MQSGQLGPELTVSFSFEATGLHKSSWEWAEVIFNSQPFPMCVQHGVGVRVWRPLSPVTIPL